MHWVRTIVVVALVAAGVVASPEEQRHVSLVPWKLVGPADAVQAPLTLFWIPDSATAMRRSPLLTSDELTRFSARCVAMRVVRLDDDVRLASLGVNGQLPVAVLADRNGRVIGSVSGDDVAEVEDLVRDELDTRTFEADSMLDAARRHADAGRRDAAMALYREVWEARCLCPRQGKLAGRALKKLERR